MEIHRMQQCFLVPIGKQVAGQANQDSLTKSMWFISGRKSVKQKSVLNGDEDLQKPFVSSYDKEWHSGILDHPQLARSEQ
jgi:hypothetical protein